MSEHQIGQKVTRSALSIVVTRADGRVEDLGVVTYWHANPLKRLGFAIAKFLGLRVSP